MSRPLMDCRARCEAQAAWPEDDGATRPPPRRFRRPQFTQAWFKKEIMKRWLSPAPAAQL